MLEMFKIWIFQIFVFLDAKKTSTCNNHPTENESVVEWDSKETEEGRIKCRCWLLIYKRVNIANDWKRG